MPFPYFYITGFVEQDEKQLNEAQLPMIITNHSSSIKYLGVLLIDYCFRYLNEKCSKMVAQIVIDVGDDHPALFTALKLGYTNISYSGSSQQVRKLLAKVNSNYKV